MKNLFIASIITLISLPLFAQSKVDFKDKWWHFGINAGVNYMDFKLYEDFPDIEKNGLGYQFGVLMNFKVTNAFSISPKAEIAFHNSKIEFVDNKYESEYELMPISLELMAHLNYEPQLRNLNPYLLIGPNIKIPLEKEIVRNTQFGTGPDVAIDFGLGVNKVLGKYCVSPEFRYSFGLWTINQYPVYQFFRTHYISFVMNFQI